VCASGIYSEMRKKIETYEVRIEKLNTVRVKLEKSNSKLEGKMKFTEEANVNLKKEIRGLRSSVALKMKGNSRYEFYM
jgi:predicted component of type VI protein secretion system